MIDRRRFFDITAGAATTLALTPELLRIKVNGRGFEVEFVVGQAGEVTQFLRLGSQEVRGRRKPKL